MPKSGREELDVDYDNHSLQEVDILLIMIVVMPSKAPLLYPTETKQLRAFGERLKRARLLRRFSSALVAERSNISRQTLTKAEQGNPNVTLGIYLRIMAVLGLRKDFDLLGTNDPLAKIYLEYGIPIDVRKRAEKRVKTQDLGSDELKTRRTQSLTHNSELE